MTRSDAKCPLCLDGKQIGVLKSTDGFRVASRFSECDACGLDVSLWPRIAALQAELESLRTAYTALQATAEAGHKRADNYENAAASLKEADAALARVAALADEWAGVQSGTMKNALVTYLRAALEGGA